eukprot:6806298-Pyramimonas_sp.AAC.1
MVTALRDHWQPDIAAKPVDEAKVTNYIHARVPKGEILDIETPAKPHTKAFLQRTSPSAPGPDCLPYSAWLAHDASLTLLETVSFFLCSGQCYIRGLNDPNFAILPKGDN